MFVNLAFFALYLLFTFLGSLIQDRPIYAHHLAYKGFYLGNYGWIDAYAKAGTDKWQNQQLKWCSEKVFAWGEGNTINIKEFPKNTLITIAVALAALIVSHMIFAVMSKAKAAPKKPEDEKLKE